MRELGGQSALGGKVMLADRVEGGVQGIAFEMRFGAGNLASAIGGKMGEGSGAGALRFGAQQGEKSGALGLVVGAGEKSGFAGFEGRSAEPSRSTDYRSRPPPPRPPDSRSARRCASDCASPVWRRYSLASPLRC